MPWKYGDPRKYKDRSTAYKRRQNKYCAERNKALIIRIKSVPCMDCGNRFPPHVMDFDHVRGEKLMTVSGLGGTSTSRVLREIEKCDIVCANCHRIRTHVRSR